MSKKTAIQFDDRDRLIKMLEPIADVAGDRPNLTRLAGKALDEIEALVDNTGNADLRAWFRRTARHALADRVYEELNMLLKAKEVQIKLPFQKKPIAISPRQGVRLPGMKEYQQVTFLAFTWDEYAAWRLDQLTRFERVREVREIIKLIDQVRMTNPDVPNISAALRLGGAQITAVEDVNAA